MHFSFFVCEIDAQALPAAIGRVVDLAPRIKNWRFRQTIRPPGD